MYYFHFYDKQKTVWILKGHINVYFTFAGEYTGVFIQLFKKVMLRKSSFFYEHINPPLCYFLFERCDLKKLSKNMKPLWKGCVSLGWLGEGKVIDDDSIDSGI